LGEPEGVSDFALADQFNEPLLLEMKVEDRVLVQDLSIASQSRFIESRRRKGIMDDW
jgi:hypothetical protein